MASRVTITGITQFKNTEFQIIRELSDRQIRDLAINTEKIIQRKITESLQRPGSTGNLARSFFAEPIGSRSWGVGNISYLNAHSPYWRWINFGVAGTGRTTPPTTIGAFSPGNPEPNSSDFRKGKFQHGGGGFLLIPKKPIEPHNYIARTLIEIPSLISTVLQRIKR